MVTRVKELRGKKNQTRIKRIFLKTIIVVIPLIFNPHSSSKLFTMFFFLIKHISKSTTFFVHVVFPKRKNFNINKFK